jgi:hypothetical protein
MFGIPHEIFGLPFYQVLPGSPQELYKSFK